MFDHASIPVSDYARSRRFYDAALAPLGFALVMEATPGQTESGKHAAGFGPPNRPAFWIGEVAGDIAPSHIAFEAPNHEAVQKFYDAALQGGARDNGPPGPRRNYDPNYYAAFVLDPDGHNIEAVCRKAEAK